MKSTHISSRSNGDKGDVDEAAINQLSEEVVLGNLIWVRLYGSSWWPTQVVDEKTVSQRNKPRNRSAGEVLVRLYGSYKYMYVDPMTCRSECENILEQNNGNYSEILKKTLEQDLARLKSGRAKRKGSIFKGKVRVGSPQDKKAKQNISTKKIQEIKSPISTIGAMGSHASARVQGTSPSPCQRRVSPRRLFSETTEETKSKKQKQDRVQKKLRPDRPNPVRSSPRLSAASKPHTMLKNGELLPENVERGVKNKDQNQDVAQKKHEPNTSSKSKKAVRSKAANQDGAVQKKLKPETPSPATNSAAKSQELTARRRKVMETLGLIAPSGSPFNRNGQI